MNSVGQVEAAMIAYYTGDARRINHFLKVYALAKAIGEGESLAPETQFTLEIAALMHDIGIKNSEQKYLSAAGEYQQVEGPPEARQMLMALAMDPVMTDRVCWLIAHHHTYADIQGTDYQILVEADFLVNIYEDRLSLTAIRQVEARLFRTRTGIAFLHAFYPDVTA